MATPPPDVSHTGSDDPWLEVVATPQHWSVGEVSRLMQVPVSTLRSWDHRYGIGPQVRQEGRHRRYDAHDVADVQRFATLLSYGLSTTASRRATEITRVLLHRHPVEHLVAAGHEHDQAQLAAAPALVAAAAALDYDTFAAVVHAVLGHKEVDQVWAAVISPALSVIEALHRRGDVGVEAIHIASDALTYTLRALIYAATEASTATEASAAPGATHEPTSSGAATPRGAQTPEGGGVSAAVGVAVLASLDEQLLPVLALQLALARRHVECIQLGAQLPIDAVPDISGRVTANWYFIWDSSDPSDPSDRLRPQSGNSRPGSSHHDPASMDRLHGQPGKLPTDSDLVIRSVAPHRPPGLFILGGSGWAPLQAPHPNVRVTRVDTLAAAIAVVPAVPAVTACA